MSGSYAPVVLIPFFYGRQAASQTALLFSKEQPFRQDVLRFFFGMSGKWKCKNQLAKLKSRFTGNFVRLWKRFLKGRSEQRVQNDGIAIHVKSDWARKPS